MKAWTLGAGVVACAVGSVAYAETWVAPLTFESGLQSCAMAQTTRYTYTHEGTVFTMTGENGKMFTITAPESGDVNHNFKSANGGSFNITGNVKVKTFTITNTGNGCKWKSFPKK